MTMPIFLDYWAGLSWREYAKHILIYLAVSTLLVLLGPFDTYQDPFVWRLSYWLIMLGFYGGVVMPLCALAFVKNARFREMAILPGTIVLIVFSALPMTLFVALMDVVLVGLLDQLAELQFAASLQLQADPASARPPPYDPSSLAKLYFKVLPIVLMVMGMVSLFIIGLDRHDGQTELQGYGQVRPGVSFFSRLPETIGTELICLRMEDHYIRVVTRLGEALILMRMRDAIQELDGVAGLQVHRSWWVATAEIVRLSRQGRRVELSMTNGMRVPVSDPFRAALDPVFSQSERNLIEASAGG